MRYDPTLHAALQPALPAAGHNRAVHDSLPLGAFGLIAGAAGAMMLAYWLTFAAHAEAAFMVAISIVYVLMYAGTPWLMARIGGNMLRQRHGGRAAPALGDFLDGVMDTATGPIGGRAALVQVAIIPVGLAVATIGICIVVATMRAAAG